MVEVLLQRGTDLLFWDELQVKAAAGREIRTDCVEKSAWKKPGEYFVRVRVDEGSSWKDLDTVERAQNHAYDENAFMNVIVFISKSGEYTFRTFDENYSCGAPE